MPKACDAWNVLGRLNPVSGSQYAGEESLSYGVVETLKHFCVDAAFTWWMI